MKHSPQLAVVLSACLFAIASRSLSAAEAAAELLPASTVFYLDFGSPEKMISQMLEHPTTRELQQLEAYEKLTQSPQFLQGMTVLRVLEFQLGMPWRQAVNTLSANGGAIAFDASTQGAVLFLKAESQEKLSQLSHKIVELVRKDAEKKGKPDPYELKTYRGIDVYKTKDGGFLTHDGWFIAGNKSDLARQIVDALLDQRQDNLATKPEFQKAQGRVPQARLGWSYINLAQLRESNDQKLQKLFSGRADDLVGEILLGGILESFKDAPYISSWIQAQGNQLTLGVEIPYASENLTELRHHYFGAEGTGKAPAMQSVPGMLFGIAAHRNLSEVWLRSGDLFDEKVNDQLAQADSNLSTFFSGKDFGEEILGALTPQIQIIAARQDYPDDKPTPSIKVPGFALIAEMKDPETSSREFRRVFQSFIGFFNVIGAMNGQPQLDLNFETISISDDQSGEVISATPIPLSGEEMNRQASLNFNFSPTIGFAGKRLVLSSTTDLAKKILEQKSASTVSDVEDPAGANTQFRLYASELQSVLDDNSQHLISQNMLKEGHTREEAELQVSTLLELLKRIQSTTFSLTRQPETLKAQVQIQLSE